MSDETVAKTRPRRVRPQIEAEVPETAMVLAAGLGTRMAPLTDDRPKALVEMGGRPLIDGVLNRLERAGVKRAVVNLHAHADRLQAHLQAREGEMAILFSDERDKLLDTGGAIKKALPLLGEDPILVVNCDVVWRDGLVDTLAHLANRWDAQTMDALLLIVHSYAALGYDGRGDFQMDALGRLYERPEGVITSYVFAGIHILKPDLAGEIEDEAFSLRAVWKRALEAGRLFGLVHDGIWGHVGTPEARHLVERALFD